MMRRARQVLVRVLVSQETACTEKIRLTGAERSARIGFLMLAADEVALEVALLVGVGVRV